MERTLSCLQHGQSTARPRGVVPNADAPVPLLRHNLLDHGVHLVDVVVAAVAAGRAEQQRRVVLDHERQHLAQVALVRRPRRRHGPERQLGRARVGRPGVAHNRRGHARCHQPRQLRVDHRLVEAVADHAHRRDDVAHGGLGVVRGRPHHAVDRGSHREVAGEMRAKQRGCKGRNSGLCRRLGVVLGLARCGDAALSSFSHLPSGLFPRLASWPPVGSALPQDSRWPPMVRGPGDYLCAPGLAFRRLVV